MLPSFVYDNCVGNFDIGNIIYLFIRHTRYVLKNNIIYILSLHGYSTYNLFLYSITHVITRNTK